MEELWKDMVGYEDFYSVSNLGRIWSKRKNKALMPSINNCGYKQVNVTDGVNIRIMLVHRAVAMAFLENKQNFPVVNHKDENTQNNEMNNLEWCTVSYNNSYNDIAKRRSNSKKKVYQYDSNFELIKTYNSSHDASREMNVSNGIMSQCCREDVYEKSKGKRNLTIYGFVFSYRELDAFEVQERFFQSKYAHIHCTGRLVGQYELDGTLIKTYESTNKAGKSLGISASNISACCRGKFKQSHGFRWEYMKEKLS